MIQLKRSTFVKGCWSTAGIATVNLMLAFGFPNTFHVDPLIAIYRVFVATSVGLNLAFASAWLAARLDHSRDADAGRRSAPSTQRNRTNDRV
jgi:hypothetical protein